MSIADKLQIITENVPKVYSKGFADGYSDGETNGKSENLRAMWEAIQNGGARTDYSGLLNHTILSKSTFKPIYDISLTGTQAYNWMNNYPGSSNFDILATDGQVNMKELEEEQGIAFSFSGCTNMTKTFSGGLFSELNVIDISQATNLAYTFYGGYFANVALRLKRIEKLICSETTTFTTTTFQHATKLEYIGFEGVIASSINLSSCPLVPESIRLAINCLKDLTGTTLTLTLGTDNLNKLSDAEKAIATERGWTLA